MSHLFSAGDETTHSGCKAKSASIIWHSTIIFFAASGQLSLSSVGRVPLGVPFWAATDYWIKPGNSVSELYRFTTEAETVRATCFILSRKVLSNINDFKMSWFTHPLVEHHRIPKSSDCKKWTISLEMMHQLAEEDESCGWGFIRLAKM